MISDNNGDSQVRKQHIRLVFDGIAKGYDDLRFIRECARRLVELTPLPRGARVLDIASGTGLVALVAAQMVGPRGRVVGVDLSPGMLALAQEKQAASGLSNVHFREGDGEQLDFPDASFEVVICASGLFFFPDMRAALREWHRVLAPSGVVAFTGFGQAFLQPLADLWIKTLGQHGIQYGGNTTQRLKDPETGVQLLREAGFISIEQRSEQLGYYHASAEERWQEILDGLEGRPLRKLSLEEQARVKADYFRELEPLTTLQGIWVDVPVTFLLGWKESAV